MPFYKWFVSGGCLSGLSLSARQLVVNAPRVGISQDKKPLISLSRRDKPQTGQNSSNPGYYTPGRHDYYRFYCPEGASQSDPLREKPVLIEEYIYSGRNAYTSLKAIQNIIEP